MNIQKDQSLKDHTTMRLGGPARYMTAVHTKDELLAAHTYAREAGLAVLVLGGGSNMIVRDEGFDGLVLKMAILGFDVLSETEDKILIKIGAGEVWDSTVERIVGMGWQGIEAMSGIPGTVGAAPVQNIGAYGQEIADTLQSLEAYDTASGAFVTLQAEDCRFSYRDSIFRGAEQGRYIITSVTIELARRSPEPPFYDSLQKYLDEHNITSYTLQAIRDSVLKIREKKLPNPAILPNAGSFFKNALISKVQRDNLLKQYPSMPSYDMGDVCKVASGWLIEQAGLKGQIIDGMQVHEHNALVLVNKSAASYVNLANAREQIINLVLKRFDIKLEQEPLEI